MGKLALYFKVLLRFSSLNHGRYKTTEESCTGIIEASPSDILPLVSTSDKHGKGLVIIATGKMKTGNDISPMK